MRAPHILNLAKHVGLVLLTRSMVTVLLVEATSSIVLRTLVIVVNVVKLGHHSSIAFLAFKQRRIHGSFSASVASTFTSQSRCVKSVIARRDAFTT